MSLNLIVLVKQVPDTQNISGEAMKEDGTVNRAALPAIFNPEDLCALEAALQVKDANPDARIHVLTMGPGQAVQVLKESLFRGADCVALISDRRFAGADTLATSYALKCAIGKIGDYDMVFCGRQAIDGDTAQVGPQTAEKLGINQITNISVLEQVDAKKKEVIARRSIEGGYEIIKAKFPILLTFTDEHYVARPPSAIKMLAYKNATTELTQADFTETYMKEAKGRGEVNQIFQWDIEAIKADPESCGLAGSPTKVKNIESVVLVSGETKMIENTHEAIAGMVHELIADHTLG